MAMTMSVLASGSRGNCTFIKTECVRLLIDAGLSRKEIAKRLEHIGEDPDGIDVILITHEHNDHAAGLRMLVKDLPAKVYLTQGTMNSLRAQDYELNGSQLVSIQAGQTVTFGDVEIRSFGVPHDAAEPVAFSIVCGGVKITQLTDVGYMSDSVARSLQGSHALILESNHDLEMLRVGPYPWSLKQRLMGRFGHLSNTAVGRFLREQYDGKADHLVLAHLSSKNNHPEIARQESLSALRDRGFHTTAVAVTSQDQPTPPIQL